MSDVLAILADLFLGTQKMPCQKAADANDDGQLDISDAVFLLGYLYLDGDAPNDPQGNCGVDPTPDELKCGIFPACK